MEATLLAGVLQSDTHKRLAVAEELLEWTQKEENDPLTFPELDRLVGGLAGWMSSSNFKVSESAMKILCVLVSRMKEKFRPHIPTIMPALKERMGDAKEQVKEQAQLLSQQMMVDAVSSPQSFLDKLLEAGLQHKNWRVKDQSLICLTRTLNYFGAGQISVSKHMSNIVSLLGDANSQVRSGAMEAIVEVYRHVGVKVRIDLSKRSIPQSRLAILVARFDAIDTATQAVDETTSEDVPDDASSCSSSVSARTQGSAVSMGSSASRSRTLPRPSSSRGMASSSGGGGVDEEDFEKAFSDAPTVNIYTTRDLESTMSRIQSTLAQSSNSWELRVTALKELKAVAGVESVDHQLFLAQLKNMEQALLTSLKDLRSQVTREACVTFSFLSVVFAGDFASTAELMMSQLIPLLSNSAKVMATSAAVCIKFFVKNCPNHRLLGPLAAIGLSSKSAVIRKQCAESIGIAVHTWSRPVVEKCASLLEEQLKKGLVDADAATRKHFRRMYWGYNQHCPSRAQRLYDSLDPHLQRHISEDRGTNDDKGLTPRPASSLGARTVRKVSSAETKPAEAAATDSEMAKLQKALANLQTTTPSTPSSSKPTPLSPTHSLPAAPMLRVQRPTVRIPRTKPPLRPASSSENILSSDPISPYRPPSRSGGRSGIRPPSRTGGGLHKKRSSELLIPLKSGARVSRSHQPSPAHSRESSPGRPSSRQSSLPRKVAPPTRETMLRLFGGGAPKSLDGEDDDAGSVTSERSTFSISSEVSVSPYSKYPNPISDLNELIVLCSSQSWTDRKDGIAQLKLLLETSREFNHSDMQMVKAVFKRMFSEPQMKIYSLFLDTLSLFIEEHREYLDDWLFLMLLRLIHRHGSDLLAHMHYKLQMVLEQIRKSFEPDQQFATMCRILNDQSQPMGLKVRLAWLEYMVELLPLMESGDFRDTSETRQALSRLLQSTLEPKSADVRRVSQKVVISLFDLNPATLSLMLRAMAKPLQEAANKILSVYVKDASSSDEEQATPTNPASTPSKRPRSRAGARRQQQHISEPPSSTPSQSRTPRPRSGALYRSNTPSRNLPPPSSSSSSSSSSSTPSSGLRTPSRSGMASGKRFSSSTPDVSGTTQATTKSGLRQPTPRSHIPTPSSSSSSSFSSTATPTSTSVPSHIPCRPSSTTPGATPHTVRTQPHPLPPRAQSAMAQRPDSARSHYNPGRYQNVRYQNGEEIESSGSFVGGPDLFSFADLPRLDYGSGDEKATVEPATSRDQMAMALRDLQAASSPKLRQAALQTIFTLARGYPEKCHWEEHFDPTLRQLLDLMQGGDVAVQALSVRVLREMLKSEHQRFSGFAEQATLRILTAFADSDATVSQAAEDTFSLLAPALPPHAALQLLSPMVAKEKYPMLLGCIKLLTKVATISPVEVLHAQLPALVPGLTRGYSHQESTVRKASVFCLVAIHVVVGPELKDHLSKLSSSQTKLLDLYIRRHQQQTGQQNVPR